MILFSVNKTTDMKLLFDFKEELPGTFKESVQLLWKEYYDECVISLFLVLVHTILVLKCSSQPDAAHGIWFGMVLTVLIIYLKVMLSDRRLWAVHVFYFAWFLYASYHARFGIFA